MAGRLGINTKELMKSANVLLTDQIIATLGRLEMKENAQKASNQTYYFINYSHAINVIKWRMWKLQNTIDSQLRNVSSTALGGRATSHGTQLTNLYSVLPRRNSKRKATSAPSARRRSRPSMLRLCSTRSRTGCGAMCAGPTSRITQLRLRPRRARTGFSGSSSRLQRLGTCSKRWTMSRCQSKLPPYHFQRLGIDCRPSVVGSVPCPHPLHS